MIIYNHLLWGNIFMDKQMDKKADIKIVDIAREANVSTATVCRVLNDKNNVSDDVRTTVQNIINKYNYKPQRVHKKTTQKPLIIVTTERHITAFYAQVLSAIQEQAEEHGYLMYIFPMPQDPEKQQDVFRYLQQQQPCAGMISAGFYLSPENWVRVQEQLRLPTVIMNTQVSHPNIACLRVNFQSAITNAMRHLVDLGHERIAYLGDMNDQFSQDELAGVERAMKERGWTYPEEYRFSVALTPEGASQGVSRIMMLPEELRPTAIIAFDDDFAINILNALRYYQLRVPEDISVIGFDNIPISARTYPSLTTVDVPKYRIGQQLVELLMQLIDNRQAEPIGNIFVDGTLVVRASTGPAKK
jgi:DNA-binding LacI/PurR family transcriptional regulator